MKNARTSVPRLRDLGDQRQPLTGLGEVIRVGDVGDLPYAVADEPEPRRLPVATIAVAVAVLLVALAVIGFLLLT